MGKSVSDPGAKLFRDAMASFASGVNVVSVWDGDGRPYGMTASAFTSVSVDPQLVLVCLNRGCRTYREIRAESAFGVNILGQQGREIADHCARPGVDKTLPADWLRGPTLNESGNESAPHLRDALAFVDCALDSEIPAGGHAILVGSVRSIRLAESGQAPLVYFRGGYRRISEHPDGRLRAATAQTHPQIHDQRKVQA